MSTDASSQPEVQQLPIVALTPAPWNPRSIKDERFQNLCKSIEADPEFLWRRPVLAQGDGTLISRFCWHRNVQKLFLNE